MPVTLKTNVAINVVVKAHTPTAVATKDNMKTVTPEQLRLAFEELFPDCRNSSSVPKSNRDFEWNCGVWLDNYQKDPAANLAVCFSLKGMLSRSLYHALGISPFPDRDKRALIVNLF